VGLKPISVANWGFLQCFDAVGWVIWPVKIVPEMTYKVSSGTLNLCSLTHFWLCQCGRQLLLNRIVAWCSWVTTPLTSDQTGAVRPLMTSSVCTSHLILTFSLLRLVHYVLIFIQGGPKSQPLLHSQWIVLKLATGASFSLNLRPYKHCHTTSWY